MSSGVLQSVGKCRWNISMKLVCKESEIGIVDGEGRSKEKPLNLSQWAPENDVVLVTLLLSANQIKLQQVWRSWSRCLAFSLQ